MITSLLFIETGDTHISSLVHILQSKTVKPRRTIQRMARRYVRRNRRTLVRASLLSLNVVLLGGVVYFVSGTQAADTVSPQVAFVASSSDTGSDRTVANPLDQLSSTEIAVHVSRMAHMETAIAVTNQADSVSSRAAIASHDDAVVSKPQIMHTDTKTKDDIITYAVKEGDTVGRLANRFNVTSDSIRWSNDLSAWASLRVGQELTIPPINGIVYTVEDGDTAADLADRFQADEKQITRFNDGEIDGLVVGDKIVIPDGEQPARQTATTAYYGFSFGSRAIYGHNGYVPGYCTYYVASRVSVPTNWGNARNWAAGARATPGWNVSQTPRPGAIAQTTAMHWLGHVAVVDEVRETSNGLEIRYSDMNGLAGFGRVGTSGWVPASTYQFYIHR